MADSLDSRVAQYVNGSDDSQVTNIAEALTLTSQALPLHKLVETLGPVLTNIDVEVRGRGTRLLSSVLQTATSLTLNEVEVQLLADFYCDRAKDRHLVIPHVLCGLWALVSYHSLPDGAVRQICSAVFKEIHIQGLSQGERRYFYNIVLAFLENRGYQEELKTFAQDFVFGYIQAMDGERDPRNLLLAFNCAKMITEKLPFEMFAEDLFEVIACYFPVDFTPPANDPHGITKDDLVLSLRQCLSASSKFGMFCLPLLLEKISSNVGSAKLDSLETLIACTQTYKAEDFSAFSEDVWRAIRQEVFQPVSETIKESALSALASITRNMALGLNTDSSSALEKFLHTILKECVGHLKEPSLRLIRPSGLVLQSVASATDPACVAVVNAALPVLLSKYTETMQGVYQRNILEVVLGVLKATREFSDSHDVSSPLLPFKESLLLLFYTTLNHSDDSVRCAGLSGLATLFSLPELLTQEEESVSAHHVTELLLEDVSHVVKSESVSALSVLGFKAPSIIQKETLPLLLHHRSDGDDVNLLTCLSAVSVHLDIIQVTAPEILTRINHCSQDDANQKKSISISVCAFNSLASLVKAHSNNVDIMAYIEQFVLPNLIAKPICAVTQDPLAEWNVYYECETLSALCSCVQAVMLALDTRSQHRVVDCLSDLFINGQSKSMNDVFDVKPAVKFQPLQPHSPWQQTQLVCLLTAVLCHCKKDIHCDTEGLLLEQLWSLACNCLHQVTCTAAAKCLAGIVNRMPDGEELHLRINCALESVSPLLDDKGSPSTALRGLTVWLWVCKSLVIRSHDLAKPMVNKLAEAAADGFYIILSDCPDVMSDTSVCNTRLMYRQQFFVETVPKLVDGFNQSQPDGKEPFLRALSHVLQSVPKQVLLSELPPLMPLLIQSLYLSESSLRTSTLTTLYSLVHDAPLVISQHISSLIPPLLLLSKQSQQMAVRIAALQCVGVMTILPHHVVFPYRMRVIRELASPLDDKKRLVRNEAVKCRGEWFLLGSAKE